MTPGVLNLTIYRGDSYRWQFKLWDATDVPTDLTDVIVAAEIRDKAGGKLLTPLACVITLPNTIDCDLSAAACRLLTTSTAAWDLELTYSTGEVSTVLAGSVKITSDVTRVGVVGVARHAA